MRRLFPLLALALAACTSNRPHLRTTLGPNARAEVRVTDAARVRVKNGGPGRLQVRFGEEVGVWITPGGRVATEPRGDARIVLLTEGESARVDVVANGATGIALESRQ